MEEFERELAQYSHTCFEMGSRSGKNDTLRWLDGEPTAHSNRHTDRMCKEESERESRLIATFRRALETAPVVVQEQRLLADCTFCTGLHYPGECPTGGDR